MRGQGGHGFTGPDKAWVAGDTMEWPMASWTRREAMLILAKKGLGSQDVDAVTLLPPSLTPAKKGVGGEHVDLRT